MKIKKMMRVFVLFLLIITTNDVLSGQEDIDQEINYYAEVFSGENYKKQKEQYTFSGFLCIGLSSPKIFDQVAEKFAASRRLERFDVIGDAIWNAKVLALSGNEKYRPLMVDMSENAKSRNLRKSIKSSLKQMDRHIRWNPVISKNLSEALPGKLESYRLVTTLKSVYDYEITRCVARRIYYAPTEMDPTVAQALAERIELEMTRQSNIDNVRIDALAWLTKALGSSKDLAYEPLLKKVAKTAYTAKVRIHTRKALRELKR